MNDRQKYPGSEVHLASFLRQFDLSLIFFLFYSYLLSRTTGEGISEIRWLFPIQGIPESRPIKESYGALIGCQARDRIEERLEVTLAGVAPSTSGQHKSIISRSVTPKDTAPKVPSSIVVGESEFMPAYFRKMLDLLEVVI